MEGLFLIFLVVFSSWFIPEAAKRIRSTVQIGRKPFLATVFTISLIIVIVFPQQASTGIATSIGLSVIYPPLCLLKKQRRYAAITAISIIAIVATWYILYLINFLGKVICLILLILAWFIARYEVLVDFIGKIFIG